VDINDDASSPLVWCAKHVNYTQRGFFLPTTIYNSCFPNWDKDNFIYG
jgi:hypothetical protein